MGWRWWLAAAVYAIVAAGLANGPAAHGQIASDSEAAQAEVGGDSIQLFITFAPSSDTQDDSQTASLETQFVRERGGEVVHEYGIVNALAIQVSPEEYGLLTADSRVAGVELNSEVHSADAELDSSWGVKRIGGGPAHDEGFTGAGVKVAVIDSGINASHEDLLDAYDPSCSYDFVNGDRDPADDNGHGSHVSGIIAAAENGRGVVGVSPAARICSYKVLTATGGGNWGDVLAALDRAVHDGARVANLSLGSTEYPGDVVAQAFANAQDAGLLMVAAAGNTGDCAGDSDSVLYPARFPEVIAVGATDANDIAPCFSSSGPALELAAPGTNIYSSSNEGATAYRFATGTSMAAPHVAGVAALLFGCKPTLTAAEVRSALDSSALDLDNPLLPGQTDGLDTWYGYGLVQAHAALESAACLSIATPAPTPNSGQTPSVPTPTSAAAAPGLTPCVTAGGDVDSDCDGLPDRFEGAHGCLSQAATSASADADNDGLSNMGEFEAGTDPCNADTDGDGLEDGVELSGVSDELGTFITDPLRADTDGDGCGDGKEIGTDESVGGRRDPTNPWDFFDVNHDGLVKVADLVAVVRQFRVDRYLGPPYAPTTPNRYYREEVDRSYGGPNPWNLRGPDGRVHVDDVADVIQQYGHDCQ